MTVYLEVSWTGISIKLNFDTLNPYDQGQRWLLRNNNGYTTIYNVYKNLALDFNDNGNVDLNSVNNGDSQMFKTTDGSSLVNKKTKKYLSDLNNKVGQSSSIIYLKFINV